MHNVSKVKAGEPIEGNQSSFLFFEFSKIMPLRDIHSCAGDSRRFCIIFRDALHQSKSKISAAATQLGPLLCAQYIDCDSWQTG